MESNTSNRTPVILWRDLSKWRPPGNRGTRATTGLQFVVAPDPNPTILWTAPTMALECHDVPMPSPAEPRTGARVGLLDAALTGAVGEWVLAAAPHTEADPAALLISALVACGVVVGGRPHLWAGDARQSASLFAVVVADTPKANRGLSWSATRRLLEVLDPEVARRQVRTGLGDGRPLLDTLHSAAVPDRHHRGERLSDPTRVLVHDPSFTRTLALAGRPASEVPLLVRSAWDGQPIELVHGRHRVEHHHIGIVAHATADQLAEHLSLSDPSVSFVNRFVFVVARRQPPLLDEGNIPASVVAAHGTRLRDNLRLAAGFSPLERAPDAEERWHEAYPELAGDDPGGLLGIMVARAARHTMRFALVHAASEASERIELRHLEAALALWAYCRESAAEVSSLRATGTTDLASELLSALEAAGGRGLSLSDQLDHFGRNVPASRLRVAREELEAAGLIYSTSERRTGSGRPATVTRAVTVPGQGS